MDNETEVLGPESYMIVRDEQEEIDDPTLTFMDEEVTETAGEAVFSCVVFLALIMALAYVATN